MLLAHSSTSVTPVNQDHFYSINATMKYHIISRKTFRRPMDAILKWEPT